MAAAPTLESWDPEGAGMVAPGREEAVHPKKGGQFCLRE